MQAKDDPEFFKTETHHKYVRTGAEEVCGLTLTQYQRLLRFMHLVDKRDQKRSSDPDHDKCFKVRPLIVLLQKKFKRWFFPGKNNAVDEAGFPSRDRCLRSYNKSNPHKYFIELLMSACSKTQFVWAFFVNESSKKVFRRTRRGAGQSKFKRLIISRTNSMQTKEMCNASTELRPHKWYTLLVCCVSTTPKIELQIHINQFTGYSPTVVGITSWGSSCPRKITVFHTPQR